MDSWSKNFRLKIIVILIGKVSDSTPFDGHIFILTSELGIVLHERTLLGMDFSCCLPININIIIIINGIAGWDLQFQYVFALPVINLLRSEW